MVSAASQVQSFVELYDLTREMVELLAVIFGGGPTNDDSEPLVLPAIARNVTWQAYYQFVEATQSRYLRHSYIDGVLELMSPRLLERENTKAVLRRMVQTLTLEAKVPIVTLGTTKLASPVERLGIEPDEAFRFSRHRRPVSELFLNVDQRIPPDLVIEVGGLAVGTDARVSAVEVDRLALLARLGIREVWSVDRGRVEILRNRNGRLIGAEQSRLLPSVSGPMLTRHLRSRYRFGENACIRNFIRDALHN